MSRIEYTKETISYLKLWLGIFVVTNISLYGWIAGYFFTAQKILLYSAIVLAIGLTNRIYSIHRKIEQLISSMETK